MWFTRRERRERDLDDEIAAHLRMAAEDRVANGDEPGAARAGARREFGNVGLVKEVTRDVWGWNAARLAATEWRSAWRGVRSRGWRAVLTVVLLGVTLSANALTFAVVDSLVFHPYPYPDSDRIVRLTHTVPQGGINRLRSATLHNEWVKQNDVFSSVGVYLQKDVFLTGRDTTQRVQAVDVSIGMLDVLGVRPQWGRAFSSGDLTDGDGFVVVIAESLARERFGRPELALGQRLTATAGPLYVVGVMPSAFAFPSTSFQIWRVMDPAGPLTTNSTGGSFLARLAPNMSSEVLPTRVAERAPALGQAAGLDGLSVRTAPAFESRATGERRTTLFVLLGAALTLLLASCANIASLELANAVARARIHAVQLALGASRFTLVRVIALEGALLIGASLALAFAMTWVAVRLIVKLIPASVGQATQNPIDVDPRALWYSLALAAVVWVFASIPSVAATWRASFASLLALCGRSATVTVPGVTLRRTLTALEVALAVALVVVGLLYTRSYQALLRLDKGFDTDGLAEVSLTFPMSHFASDATRTAFIDRMLSELRAVPGVTGATNSSPPPSLGDSPTPTAIEIDGTPMAETIDLGRKRVDPSYFPVIRLPLLSGRYLVNGDSPDRVVITESFARRFWPDTNPVGRSFRGTTSGTFAKPMTVVGVVGDFRTQPRRMPETNDRRWYVYTLWSPPSSNALSNAASPPRIDTGGSFAAAVTTVRMDSVDRLSAVRSVAVRLDPRLPVRVELVDDLYARQNADVLLARRIVGAFSWLALLVAMAGLYGAMAYLVETRRREIGIRMALGADRLAIGRLVLASSGKLVILGVAIGATGAFGVARWIQSQLFGVSPSDPATYAVVIGAVTITALAASWQPALQAARIDPAITLRSE